MKLLLHFFPLFLWPSLTVPSRSSFAVPVITPSRCLPQHASQCPIYYPIAVPSPLTQGYFPQCSARCLTPKFPPTLSPRLALRLSPFWQPSFPTLCYAFFCLFHISVADCSKPSCLYSHFCGGFDFCKFVFLDIISTLQAFRP